MADVIVIAVVLFAVCLAAGYIIRAKKKGAKCIGCPASGSCSNKGSACESESCSCQHHDGNH